MSVLTKKFFERPTLKVAPDLLGKFLCRKLGNQTAKFMVTEVEAYDGPKDKASHAHRGKTVRNAPMFSEAGVWYVYFTYGMHWMLNVVTGKQGYPAAVLIRGVEDINGPARLTKKLNINKKFNNKPATKKTGLWIEDIDVKIHLPKFSKGKFWRVKKSQIKTSPRVGVPYAEEWKDKHYRFYI